MSFPKAISLILGISAWLCFSVEAKAVNPVSHHRNVTYGVPSNGTEYDLNMNLTSAFNFTALPTTDELFVNLISAGGNTSEEKNGSGEDLLEEVIMGSSTNLDEQHGHNNESSILDILSGNSTEEDQAIIADESGSGLSESVEQGGILSAIQELFNFSHLVNSTGESEAWTTDAAGVEIPALMFA